MEICLRHSRVRHIDGHYSEFSRKKGDDLREFLEQSGTPFADKACDLCAKQIDTFIKHAIKVGV